MAKRLYLPGYAFFLTVLIRGTLAWAAVAVLAPSGTAQLQFAELSKQHLPADEDHTWAATLGCADNEQSYLPDL